MTAAYDLLAEQLRERGRRRRRRSRPRCARRRSRRPPGRTATRARASPCSRSRASRATRSRSSRTPREVHRHTGVTPSVALHIPWDRVDDFGALRDHAADARAAARRDQPEPLPGARVQARQRLPPRRGGAPARRRPHPRVRRDRRRGRLRRALALARRRHELRRPGLVRGAARAPRRLPPGGRRGAARRRSSCSSSTSSTSPRSTRTDLADWGSALLLCQALGERAKVLVDLGHHAQGVNIEQIVSLLLGAGRLGGFHFNDRKYGDDDLIVGSVDPFQLFLVYDELVARGRVRARRADDDRPVAQRRAEDRGDDPERREPAGGVREGAARRPRRAGGARRPRATCSPATASCSTRSAPTSGRSARRCAPTSARRPIPSPRSARAATASRSPQRAPSGKAAAWMLTLDLDRKRACLRCL